MSEGQRDTSLAQPVRPAKSTLLINGMTDTPHIPQQPVTPHVPPWYLGTHKTISKSVQVGMAVAEIVQINIL